MTTCYRCGAVGEGRTCTACGTRLSCTNCGTELDGPFCRACGTPVTDLPPPPPAVEAVPPVQQAPPPPRRDPSQQLNELATAARNASRTLSSSPPPWADGTPLQPATDELGQSFTWSVRSLRHNLIALAALTVALSALNLTVWLVAAIAAGVAAESSWASVVALISLISAGLILAAAAGSAMVTTRAWSMISRGVPLTMDSLVSPSGYPAVFITWLVVTPFAYFSAGLAGAFGLMALLFVTGDGLRPAAAIGQMLAVTCSSARRFFATLLISFSCLLLTAFALLAASALFAQIASGTAVTSVNAAFEGSTSAFRDADTRATGFFALTAGGLLAASSFFAMLHIFGLWTAGYLRVITGRPLGARLDTPQGAQR